MSTKTDNCQEVGYESALRQLMEPPQIGVAVMDVNSFQLAQEIYDAMFEGTYEQCEFLESHDIDAEADSPVEFLARVIEWLRKDSQNG